MYAKPIHAAIALLVGAAVVTGCTPAGQDGPQTSPTFSTIPSTTSAPLEIAGAEQVMRDFWSAHNRCGNAPTAGNAVDPAQCSRASEMMDTLPTPCISGSADSPADVEKCAQALRSSTRPSAAPAALHNDPTAHLSLVDMVHAMNTSLPRSLTDTLDWKGTRGMGSLVMSDYIGWSQRCAETGTVSGCGARDIRRSTLPSRCIVEAERDPADADGPVLCGVALLYVKHMGGGK